MPLYDVSGKNKYYTLYLKIREDITRGKFAAGDKLPSKRALAADLGVSVVTVELAYGQLLAEGYVESRERSGYFVENIDGVFSEKRRPIKESVPEGENCKYAIDFVGGSVPGELFPFSVWAKLTRKVLADCGEELLRRVPCDGAPELKKAVSDYLYRARGIEAPPGNIVIGAGAEYLYGVIVQLLGRGETFAVENPGYPGISSTYRLYGAEVAPLAVNQSGISLDELYLSDARALHISPAHQFPTGAVTPVWARLKIIEWAKSRGGYIIEDDYDSEFRLSGKPLQSLYSLCPEKVIYMNTFSKSLAPSLRMGYMVLPDALLKKFRELFSGGANVVPLFEQMTLASLLSGGYFERHILKMKNYYREVRRALVKKLGQLGAECEIIDTGSGLHMLAGFPSAKDDGEIKSRAVAAGINVKCLSDYLLSPMSGVGKYAVLNYSGITVSQIENLYME